MHIHLLKACVHPFNVVVSVSVCDTKRKSMRPISPKNLSPFVNIVDGPYSWSLFLHDCTAIRSGLCKISRKKRDIAQCKFRKKYWTVQDEKEILDCLTLLCTVFLSSSRSTLTEAASPAAALISISNYIIHSLSATSPNSVRSEK